MGKPWKTMGFEHHLAMIRGGIPGIVDRGEYYKSSSSGPWASPIWAHRPEPWQVAGHPQVPLLHSPSEVPTCPAQRPATTASKLRGDRSGMLWG